MKFRFFKNVQQKDRKIHKKVNITVLSSIKSKMVALIGLLLLFVCIGFGLVLYINSSNSLISKVEEDLPMIAQQSAKVIDSRINGNFLALEIIASYHEINNPDINPY